MTTETTATTETPAAEKPARVQMPEQNGVRRPKPETEIGQIWKTVDDLSASLGRPATRAEARDAVGTSANPATFATQYARWVKFYGVSEAVKSVRTEAATAKKAEADKAKAEKEAERNAKKAEKEAARAQREAERNAKKAEADAKAKEAADARAAEQAEKDRKAAEEKAAKDAEKAAAKAAKDEEKAKAKAERDAAKAAKANAPATPAA